MISILFRVGLVVAGVHLEDAAAPKVAVVNVAEISERYARTNDLEAHFETLRLKFNQERDAQRDRVERMKRSLQEELKPGTEEFRQRRKQLLMLEAEFQAFVETEGQKIEEGLKNSLRSIYEDIRGMVGEVAEQRGIDIVLAADRLPADSPENPTQLRQQILLQKVLYWNPRVDLTNEVVSRLNTRHKAQGSASSAPEIPASGGQGAADKIPQRSPPPPGVEP